MEADERRKARLVAEAAEAMEEEEEVEEESVSADDVESVEYSAATWANDAEQLPTVTPSVSVTMASIPADDSGDSDDDDDDEETYITCGNQVLEAERREEERQRHLRPASYEGDGMDAELVAATAAVASRAEAEEQARRQALREEFVRLMKERFLNGDDRCAQLHATLAHMLTPPMKCNRIYCTQRIL